MKLVDTEPLLNRMNNRWQCLVDHGEYKCAQGYMAAIHDVEYEPSHESEDIDNECQKAWETARKTIVCTDKGGWPLSQLFDTFGTDSWAKIFDMPYAEVKRLVSEYNERVVNEKTREDVIKALRCCTKNVPFDDDDPYPCDECPYVNKEEGTCASMTTMMLDALKYLEDD